MSNRASHQVEDMHEELAKARVERDTAFNEFVDESARATKHSLKAQAARHRYMCARDEVRALEFDYLTQPIV